MNRELSQFEMENEIILIKDKQARSEIKEQKALIDTNTDKLKIISNFIYDISVSNTTLIIKHKEA